MQIFHRSTNTISRVSVFGAVFFLAFLLWLFDALNRSPYTTRQGVTRVQPVQFSHQHHVGNMGIDCRYCHTTVEKAAFANIPPTKTCMNCLSQIWNPVARARARARELPQRQVDRVGQGLRPARLRLLQPLDPRREGRRLRDVPRAASTGCRSSSSIRRSRCRGASNATGIPSKHLRPRSEIFTMGYVPAGNQEEIGARLHQGVQRAAVVGADELHDVP
jgi:hypothetical protein